jgi:signal transduction histidine kinase
MESIRERLTIRAALLLGFALIFGLWLFGWMQLSQRIRDEQARASMLNARHVKAQTTLANIRTQVLRASVAFRDALLEPPGTNTESHRAQLERVHKSLEVLLSEYEPVSNDPNEREEFARLGRELANFKKNRLDLLAGDLQALRGDFREVLRQTVTPQRDVVIAISERIQALNSAGYEQQRAEIANGYLAVERETWQTLGLSFLIGIGVASLAAAYVARLERRLRRQMARDTELARDLQDLSARLVTVQEEERRHIARELHDEIGQALTAIKVELACAQGEIDRRRVSTSLLDTVRSITDSAIHQVRDLSRLLHPAVLDEFGLLSAVESQVKSFSTRHRVRAAVTHEGMDVRLPRAIETAAYRIIQEALTNIAKHAKASECRVHLVVTDDALQIRVSDNGVGFDPAAPRSGDRRGLGLVGMRERASHLHGLVSVDSGKGRGTRLVVDLPIQTIGESMVPSDLHVGMEIG